MKLELEINKNFVEDANIKELQKSGILMTPPLGGDNWIYRVKLTENQSLLGFKKFTTIGIGFDKEVDWNTNLPYSCDAEQIYNHIKHNKLNATKKDCLEAINMIQTAVKESKENK